MRIAAEKADSIDFIAIVDEVVDDLLQSEEPASLIVVKIDNWFGQRWLGFAGKAMGAFGISNSSDLSRSLTVPPFVPSRVISQRRFVAPAYIEVAGEKLLHRRVTSHVAMTRRASEVAPKSALMWYSGNSKRTGRGSVMVYIPRGEFYDSWYANWAEAGYWRVVERTGDLPPFLQPQSKPPSAAEAASLLRT